MSNEINIEELEQSASEVKGWRCDCSWTDTSDGIPVSVVGTIDEEGNKHPVVFVGDDQCLCGDSGSLADFYAIANPNAVLSLIDRLKKAEAELERERMRLTACGVVALADTPESAAKAREMRDEYRSASCDDVARRVDECMTLRAERDALTAKLAEMEGQEPVAWVEVVSTHEGPYNFEGMALLGKGTHLLYARPVPAEEGIVTVTTNDAGRCVMVSQQDEDHRILSVIWEAKDVPTEPVNVRLLDALKRAKDSLVAFKFVPGGANCWEASDEENLTTVNSAIAAAEAAHTEPVNVDFGKRGENMFFKIDNQSFLLEYKPEEQDEFDFMKAMLLSAFSRITHGVKTEIQPVNTRLLTALKAFRHQFAQYVAHHISKGDMHKAMANESMVAMADVAIMAAEAAPRVARLTADELRLICDRWADEDGATGQTGRTFLARAIEAAALRKNGLAMED